MIEKPVVNALTGTRYRMITNIYELAEMVELIKEGVNNIVCVQPFACLPNHVVGKAVIRRIRKNILILILLQLTMILELVKLIVLS